MNTTARTCVSSSDINKLALPITITKSGEVRFVQMFHCRFANATRVFLCRSNWWKLENMRKEPHNTYIYLNSACVDFEDMSCEMIYGQKPLPLEEDTSLQQPCYASMCKSICFTFVLRLKNTGIAHKLQLLHGYCEK